MKILQDFRRFYDLDQILKRTREETAYSYLSMTTLLEPIDIDGEIYITNFPGKLNIKVKLK